MCDTGTFTAATLRLFRIEHPDDRRGPFERFLDGADIEAMGDFLSLCVQDAPEPSDEQSSAVHPDGVRGATSAWRYACSSFHELGVYFDFGNRGGAEHLLHGYGYVVGEYLVPADRTICGNRQAVFEASAAHHVADHPIATAFATAAVA